MAASQVWRARTRRRPDEGASLVEFALVVPLLSLFLFGIVQFGIAYDKKQSINSAAREGARTAAIPVNTVNDIETAVENSFEAITSGDVETTIEVAGTIFTNQSDQPCSGSEGEAVMVTAAVEHVLTIPFFGTRPSTLNGQGEFRCEREQNS